MSENTGRPNQPDNASLPEGTISQAGPSGRPSEEKGITQVDLKKYEFEPPGPMGWTVKEYEKIIEHLQNKKEG